MKKIFTTALLAMLGAGAFAQTSQGTVSVSGSVNFRNESGKDLNSNMNTRSSNRSISLQPTVGYFIGDGLELGIGIGLAQFTSIYKWDDGNEKSVSKNNNISLNPFLRKYVALTEQLQLHGTGYVSGGIGNHKTKRNDDDSAEVISTSTNYGIGIYPGLTYFATPKLGITATFGHLSYARSKTKPKKEGNGTYPSDSNTFTADLSPSSISIGIGYYIAR